MKIAIFSGTIPSTSFIERLINGVSQHHQVLLFGKQEKAIQYTSDRIHVYATPKSTFKNAWVSLLRSIRLVIKSPKSFALLLRELKKENTRYARFSKYTKYLPIVLHQPDILHIQWAKDLPEYVFFKTVFNVKLIVSFRGAHINYTPVVEPLYQSLYKNTFPDVDAFHGVSKAIIQKASEYGNIQHKSKVIYSPLPDRFFNAYKAHKKRNDNKIRLLSVGRNHWKKGYQYAIDALYLLKERGFDVHYTFIGPLAPSEGLLFQIHELDVVNNIDFVGKLTQEELLKAYHQFDILVLPSLGEGIANVVLEAMAIGLPVISTDCGGMAEVVKDKETGWLVPMRNPKAIVEAVVDYKNTSTDDISTIVRQAHQWVKKDFSYHKNIETFIALYKSVIKQ